MFDSYDEIFDHRGEAYHHAMSLFPKARHQEFQIAVDSLALNPGDVLCDVPSGGGYLQEYLPPGLEIRLIAVDPSEVFAQQWDGASIESHFAQLDDLPISNGTCDAVVSIAGLHHVKDRKAVFAEIQRILKRHGRLCVLEVAAGSPVDPFLNKFVDAYNSMGHSGDFLDDGFRADLEAVGLAITKDELCSYTWDFADEHSMAEFVRLIFGLDKARHDEIMAGISNLLGYRCNHDGCHMNWELQVLVAEKK